ncbi:MAG: 30S ribosomal protein S13 [Nanoarchaeota archaeon]|nr:30S ribosomal protein S13 [Nanoarchaeota archaeon]
MTEAKPAKEFRHIVRVGNTDLVGEKPLFLSLQKIKGVGENFARVICVLAKMDYLKQTGEMTDKDVAVLEKILENPQEAGVPQYMFNNQKDYETGKDQHLFLADLDFKQDQDIKRLKKSKSYIGLRHQWRLPVRGQRTQSNFRPNKGRSSAVKKKSSVRK